MTDELDASRTEDPALGKNELRGHPGMVKALSWLGSEGVERSSIVTLEVCCPSLLTAEITARSADQTIEGLFSVLDGTARRLR